MTVLWWWRSSDYQSPVIPVLVSIHRQWRKIVFQRMLPEIVPSFPKTLNGYQYHSHWLINRVGRWSFRPMRFRTETFGNQSWNDTPQITTGIFSSSFASVFDSTFISEFHRLKTRVVPDQRSNWCWWRRCGRQKCWEDPSTGTPVEKNRPHSTNRPLSPRLHVVAKNEQTVKLTMWKY